MSTDLVIILLLYADFSGKSTQEQLADDGWEIKSTLDISGGTTIMAEKGNRTATVSMNAADGTTTVVITTAVVEE